MFYFWFRFGVLLSAMPYFMRAAHSGTWRRASRPLRLRVTLATSWAWLFRTTRALLSRARATHLPRRGLFFISYCRTLTECFTHTSILSNIIHLAYVQLWDIREGMCTQTFGGHESDINAIGVHYWHCRLLLYIAYNAYLSVLFRWHTTYSSLYL